MATAEGPVAGEGAKQKTAKELEKERKKEEKMAKFLAKQNKKQASKEKTEKVDKKPAKEQVALPEYQELTPPGEKKILQDLELPVLKSYNPQVVESAWYEWWVKEGFFEPEFTEDGKVKPEGLFTIPAPPPNITGALHIGHALTVSIQDALIRWERMRGKTVLYLPGFDHAGISTQSVVEKMLWKKKKQTRHDLGREKFVDLVWEWKEEYHSRIKNQSKRLGASYDWTREAFTMDENLSAAVRRTFIQLFEEGIIYRDNRLVNWCCALNTTLSNLEVENKDITGRTMLNVPGYDEPVEFGVLTSFAYPVEGSDEKLIVATTRPETMFGDTAVAVHPDDPRYKHLHGKFAVHPFVDRKLPIITDSEAVDMEFGTGAVKITPAHDPNDYATGKRHNLEFVNILNDDGTLNENCGKYAGLKRFDARKLVVKDLGELGLYIESKDNEMTVPLCAKSNDVIEPLMKPQWWVRQKAMGDAAINAVKTGEMKLEPKIFEADYFYWMENIQDWCISRQLWWGHRCPVYFVKIEGLEGQQDHIEDKWWVAAETEDEARRKAEAKFPGKSFTLEWDEDVLDTWFSSGLWPFSTLGWPNLGSKDLKDFYPMSMLETGWDIMFFWVARMAMLGIKLTGSIPFKEIYLHSLVRDAQGRKMSKSLGNVIDPLDVTTGIALENLHARLREGNLDPREIAKAEAGQTISFPNGIPECGTDAMRFALCAYTTGGRDINLDILRVEGYRKFCNKIYQATKFALLRLGEGYIPPSEINATGDESLVEKWILYRFSEAARLTNEALEKRDFFTATSTIYNFWLYELCDVYIENSKSLILEGTPEEQASAKNTLYTCLDGALKLIHPFMPFITEELWQRIPRRDGDKTRTIVKASYPTYRKDLDDGDAAAAYDLVFSVVKGARSLFSQFNILKGGSIYVQCSSSADKTTIETQTSSISALIKSYDSIDVILANQALPEGTAVLVISKDVTVGVMLKGQVDADAEIKKAEQKLSKAVQSKAGLEKIMSSKDYAAKAKKEAQEANQLRLETYDAEIETLKSMIENFEKLRV
ncbi:tRNA synthetases class I-domain-containing protein [Lipomyces tetrasporus]|uniref:valine--tRNA ligase n=1 Tax=Lipomyces tetrasporus TaxID=54092 RepID=A0AAD7VPL1_9ASCO|nr:tRNA synthetases class I-domain-containing protein [Lipomyces tetrasporus]KAJ8097283.1 tRNA synthetases class I-domain-containing protein [Lipomyces tetrasporus]